MTDEYAVPTEEATKGQDATPCSSPKRSPESPRKTLKMNPFRRFSWGKEKQLPVVPVTVDGIELKPIPDLSKLLKKAKFDEIGLVLKDETMTKDDLAPWFLNSYENGGTLLHHLVRYRSPVELIKLALLRYRRDYNIMHPEALTDNQKHTPMHVALSANCDREVVLAVADLSAMIKILH